MDNAIPAPDKITVKDINYALHWIAIAEECYPSLHARIREF